MMLKKETTARIKTILKYVGNAVSALSILFILSALARTGPDVFAKTDWRSLALPCLCGVCLKTVTVFWSGSAWYGGKSVRGHFPGIYRRPAGNTSGISQCAAGDDSSACQMACIRNVCGCGQYLRRCFAGGCRSLVCPQIWRKRFFRRQAAVTDCVRLPADLWSRSAGDGISARTGIRSPGKTAVVSAGAVTDFLLYHCLGIRIYSARSARWTGSAGDGSYPAACPKCRSGKDCGNGSLTPADYGTGRFSGLSGPRMAVKRKGYREIFQPARSPDGCEEKDCDRESR